MEKVKNIDNSKRRKCSLYFFRIACDLICCLGMVSSIIIILFSWGFVESDESFFVTIFNVTSGLTFNAILGLTFMAFCVGLPYVCLIVSRSMSSTLLFAVTRILVAIGISYFGIYAYYLEFYVKQSNEAGWLLIGVPFSQIIVICMAYSAYAILVTIYTFHKKFQAKVGY